MRLSLFRKSAPNAKVDNAKAENAKAPEPTLAGDANILDPAAYQVHLWFSQKKWLQLDETTMLKIKSEMKVSRNSVFIEVPKICSYSDKLHLSMSLHIFRQSTELNWALASVTTFPSTDSFHGELKYAGWRRTKRPDLPNKMLADPCQFDYWLQGLKS
ncbi:MAG: hypothetical protein PHH11_05550 [Methylomonas sp.]|nr:hypothetical protein [Methylomonas sp.]